MIPLFLPQQTYAYEQRSQGLSVLAYYKVSNPTLQSGNTIENTPWIPSPDSPKKKVIAASKATNYASGYGRWGCVRFAKALIGVYGTWGDGGRKLSLNSDGQIHDVVIFQILHVGVVTDRQGNLITIREWITTRYSAYERVRILSVDSSEIRGFHKF